MIFWWGCTLAVCLTNTDNLWSFIKFQKKSFHNMTIVAKYTNTQLFQVNITWRFYLLIWFSLIENASCNNVSKRQRWNKDGGKHRTNKWNIHYIYFGDKTDPTWLRNEIILHYPKRLLTTRGGGEEFIYLGAVESFFTKFCTSENC